MKTYIQLLETKLDNSIGESLGSFSVTILDGRNSLDTWIDNGFSLLKRESNLKKFAGFRIIRNDRFVDSDSNTSSTIYEFLN